MRFDLRHGDSREVLRSIDAESIDALVTDPPAGLGFMGKEWDDFRRSRNEADAGRPDVFGRTSARAPEYARRSRDAFIGALGAIFEECLRVLKPGAHGLVWAIPRTSHWTATALEDAGFEIRDVGVHIFGTGFPKSLNLGDGRGTALKPAAEHWILCRKPLCGTVAANVAAHGTGALNIDACRIGTAKAVPASPSRTAGISLSGSADGSLRNETGAESGHDPDVGRWPANVTLEHAAECERVGTKRVRGNPQGAKSPGSRDRVMQFGMTPGRTDYADADGTETIEDWRCAPGCAAALLDAQSGDLPPGTTGRRNGTGIFDFGDHDFWGGYGDTGGASRFFYVAKPDRSERDIGCEDLPAVSGGTATDRKDGSAGTQNPRAGAGRNGGARNIHPTVKSVDLMRWLCRLVTPRGGLVLDPFMGSGSTGIACAREGMRFIGIERERAYFEIARRRIVGDAPLLNRIGQLQLEGPDSEKESA